MQLMDKKQISGNHRCRDTSEFCEQTVHNHGRQVNTNDYLNVGENEGVEGKMVLGVGKASFRSCKDNVKARRMTHWGTRLGCLSLHWQQEKVNVINGKESRHKSP